MFGLGPRQVLLCSTHQLDRLVVRFARSLTPGDQPVMHQNHAITISIAREGPGNGPCKLKARFHVGNDSDVAPQCSSNPLRSVLTIG